MWNIEECYALRNDQTLFADAAGPCLQFLQAEGANHGGGDSSACWSLTLLVLSSWKEPKIYSVMTAMGR
jgi:hypothetical protein